MSEEQNSSYTDDLEDYYTPRDRREEREERYRQKMKEMKDANFRKSDTAKMIRKYKKQGLTRAEIKLKVARELRNQK